MSGHHKFSQLTKNFSLERQKEIAQHTEQLRKDLALSELRAALELTKIELAKKLDISNVAVSQICERTDLYISHLRQIIEAMGGQLEIIARFPDKEVKITNFGELTYLSQNKNDEVNNDNQTFRAN